MPLLRSEWHAAQLLTPRSQVRFAFGADRALHHSGAVAERKQIQWQSLCEVIYRSYTWPDKKLHRCCRVSKVIFTEIEAALPSGTGIDIKPFHKFNAAFIHTYLVTFCTPRAAHTY